MRDVILASILGVCAFGCVPEHHYEGDYEMTYDVSLDDGRVEAGQTIVRIREGLIGDLFVDLGPDLCKLDAVYVAAHTVREQPFFQVDPQACFLDRQEDSLDMTLGGTGTFQDGDGSQLAIVLAGTVRSKDGRGDASVELTERW